MNDCATAISVTTVKHDLRVRFGICLNHRDAAEALRMARAFRESAKAFRQEPLQFIARVSRLTNHDAFPEGVLEAVFVLCSKDGAALCA